jgi:hypothetical protein
MRCARQRWRAARGKQISIDRDVLPDFRPLTPVFLRAFPLKDDSASAPQDQHNLI